MQQTVTVNSGDVDKISKAGQKTAQFVAGRDYRRGRVWAGNTVCVQRAECIEA